jgi:hypothetical protein
MYLKYILIGKMTSPLQTTNRHAATAGGGGKNEQAPTPSLSFIPSQQKRPTLIPAHAVEGKKLPGNMHPPPPLKSKPAGRVPPDAILFCKRQKKYAKMAFSPAEGIACAGLLLINSRWLH